MYYLYYKLTPTPTNYTTLHNLLSASKKNQRHKIMPSHHSAPDLASSEGTTLDELPVAGYSRYSPSGFVWQLGMPVLGVCFPC